MKDFHTNQLPDHLSIVILEKVAILYRILTKFMMTTLRKKRDRERHYFFLLLSSKCKVGGNLELGFSKPKCSMLTTTLLNTLFLNNWVTWACKVSYQYCKSLGRLLNRTTWSIKIPSCFYVSTNSCLI